MITGQFIIVYQNRPIKVTGIQEIDGTITGPLSWMFVDKNSEATVFPNFERAAFMSKTVQFNYPKQVEVAPISYQAQDQPERIQ